MTNTTPSASDSGLNLYHLEALRRVIECCEILNQRPRPMCRDCADEDGKCPNGGLDCDMRGLFARAKAGYNELARRVAPVSAPVAGDDGTDWNGVIDLIADELEEKSNLGVISQFTSMCEKFDQMRAALANQPAPTAAPLPKRADLLAATKASPKEFTETVRTVLSSGASILPPGDACALLWHALKLIETAAPEQVAALEGRIVSVDVSTGEDDALNRIYAELTGETASDGETLIAIEQSRNFTSQPSEAAPLDRNAVLEEAARIVEGRPCSRDDHQSLLLAAQAIRASKVFAHQPAQEQAEPVALMQALTTGIPLQEPVYIGKALRAQCEARASLASGAGPKAAAFLVNIQLTPWTYTKETAQAYAEGYNRALKDYRSALLDVAASPVVRTQSEESEVKS